VRSIVQLDANIENLYKLILTAVPTDNAGVTGQIGGQSSSNRNRANTHLCRRVWHAC